LEDLTLMRLLPNIEVFSPSDWELAQRLADYCVDKKVPKYLRFDSKPVPRIYRDHGPDVEAGFCELINGRDACIVSTGYMTHVALRAAARLGGRVGVIDVFGLTPADERPLLESLEGYRSVVTAEEGFINRGGLDSYVSRIVMDNGSQTKVTSLGVDDRYLFELGGRERLHRICGIDEDGIVGAVSQVLS
jgi:transketolase